MGKNRGKNEINRCKIIDAAKKSGNVGQGGRAADKPEVDEWVITS